MAGISSSQGLHQVAQKLSRTTLPRSDSRESKASSGSVGSEKAGAGPPGSIGGRVVSPVRSAQRTPATSANPSRTPPIRVEMATSSSVTSYFCLAAFFSCFSEVSAGDPSTSSMMESGAASPMRRRALSTRV